MVDILLIKDEEKVQTTNPMGAMKVVVVCITLRFPVRVRVPQPEWSLIENRSPFRFKTKS
jgi:hypothetical protein